MSRHATFENFGMAFLTLFQVSTGDNWNGIMKVQSHIQNIVYKALACGTQAHRQTSYNFLSICVLKGRNTGIEKQWMVQERQETNSSVSLIFHSSDAYWWKGNVLAQHRRHRFPYWWAGEWLCLFAHTHISKTPISPEHTSTSTSSYDHSSAHLGCEGE